MLIKEIITEEASDRKAALKKLAGQLVELIKQNPDKKESILKMLSPQ